MKKFLPIAAFMVLALLMCASCSNSNEPDNPITGQWKQTWSNGKPGETGSYRILEIRADHTFTWGDYSPNGELEEIVDGTWKRDGNWRTPTNMEYMEYPKILFLFEDEYNDREWGIIVDNTTMIWLYDTGDMEPYPYIKQ